MRYTTDVNWIFKGQVSKVALKTLTSSGNQVLRFMTEIQATCGAVLIWASFFQRSSPRWEHSVNYSALLGQVLYCWIFTMQCFKDTKNINSISSPLHWKLGLFPECSRSGWATADVRYDRAASLPKSGKSEDQKTTEREREREVN